MSFTTGKDHEHLNAIFQHTNNTEKTYRSLEHGLEESLDSGYPVARQNTKGQKTQDRSSSGGIWAISDKTFLDQHVMLNDNVSADNVFEFLLDEIRATSEGYKNYREFYEDKKIVGFHFDESRQGLYRVELFQLNENLGVNCTRLDGDGFAVTHLWEHLKRTLVAENFAFGDMDLEGDSDDEMFLSDDEEFDDFDFDFKYLDLSRDPTFVNRLIQDIEDFNVGTHSLMLLAFNLLSDQNLTYLTTNYAQAIFDAIVLRLSKPFGVTLPVARCAGRVIAKLVNNDAVTANVEQMKTIIDTVQKWSTEDSPRKTIIPTASEEAAVLLTSVYGGLTQSIPDSDSFDLVQHLEDVIATTDFDLVKDNLAPFVASN